MNPLFGIVMVTEQESGSSGGSPFKKWFMRQYWRVQQSQTIISMAFWVTTLTLLIWPYLRWRFENDSTIAGISVNPIFSFKKAETATSFAAFKIAGAAPPLLKACRASAKLGKRCMSAASGALPTALEKPGESF